MKAGKSTLINVMTVNDATDTIGTAIRFQVIMRTQTGIGYIPEAFLNSVEAFCIGTGLVGKSRRVEQVKLPRMMGIPVFISACIFLDVGRLRDVSDGFASDKVDELSGIQKIVQVSS